MKKTLLFISALIAGFSSYAQYEGFENWTSNNVQLLDDYQTSVNERGVDGTLATYPSTDAVTGTKSVRLETVLSPANGDTLFGYLVDGDPDNQTPGLQVSLNNVDSIIGWYKYDILANDSAVLLAMTTFMGSPTGGGTYYIKGTQPTWKRFAYYVNAIAADSALFGAASSDAINNYNGKPGSWIQFDDIQLKSTTGQLMNVANSSFENWTSVSVENPNSWNTSNLWVDILEPTKPVNKTTDAYAGSFALELQNLAGIQGDSLIGGITNGKWGNNGPFGGQPYTATPTGVEIRYKYAPATADQACINIEFKNNGTVVGNAGNCFTTAQSTYQLWTQNFSTGTPDSLLISIWNGNKFGSVLKVDNIDFLFPVGVSEQLTVEKLVTYPNPTTDELKIKFELLNANKVTIRLIDVTGKQLTSRSLGNLSTGIYRETFNTRDFSTGIYFIEFTLGNNKIVKRFVVK